MSEHSTALAVRQPAAPAALPTDAEIDRMFRVAKALAMSGMFKDTRQAEQAFAKILVGRDLGLSPTQAMMGIHIVEGKPELSANLQAAFVKQSPRHDFRVVEHTDEACEIAFYLDDEEVGRSRFTMDDARRAGLAGRGPWKSYPRNMLYARAVSNGVAFHCPEVTGGLRVYSEGEIGGDERPPELESEAAPTLPLARAEDPPPDIPADWPPKAEAPAEDPPPAAAADADTDAALLVDDTFALDIAAEFKRQGLRVGDFRDMLTAAGAEVPAELRSAEARRDALKMLTLDQALHVAELLRERARAEA